MHRLKTDLANGIIEIDIEGLWNVAQVDALARELDAAARAVAATGRRHRALYDYSRALIQPQDVVAALQQLARDFEIPAQRIALYTGGRFAKLQAQRIAAVRDGIATFCDRKAAIAWLTEKPA